MDFFIAGRKHDASNALGPQRPQQVACLGAQCVRQENTASEAAVDYYGDDQLAVGSGRAAAPIHGAGGMDMLPSVEAAQHRRKSIIAR